MFKFLSTTALVMLAAGTADATINIAVSPSLAPNAFGSPSYAAYVTNATGALHDGATSRGDPSLPSYYQARSTVTAAESIVTGFPSWLGKADPGTVFGAAFANELGNRMLFGIKIDGGGSQFRISQLSFTATSSDPLNTLGFSFDAGSYAYSDSYVGVLKGTDGILFTADDVYVTSGSADTLVDGLVGRGSGSSLAAYCDGCTTAQQQQAIDDAAAYFTSDTTFTGTYGLLGVREAVTGGSGSFIITASAVPEPASWAMMIGGFGLIGAAMRRRQTTTQVAFA